LRRELLAELLQLRDGRAGIAYRVRIRLDGSDVHEMQQHARALQMLQESDTQSGSLRRALDEPRNIRHYEAASLTYIDDAEIGNERSERVIRHLRSCRRNGANERGFAGIGES